jgi:hypothetical protein
MEMTRHADMRRLQRCVPLPILETISAYGTAHHTGGALSLSLDRKAIDQAVYDNRHLRSELERYSGVYLVLGKNERVVTVARSRRRFCR